MAFERNTRAAIAHTRLPECICEVIDVTMLRSLDQMRGKCEQEPRIYGMRT
jgi:hypothetical protein